MRMQAGSGRANQGYVLVSEVIFTLPAELFKF